MSKKEFAQIALGGVIGSIFTFVLIFLLAHHYQTTPVALINSNPNWKGWQEERYQFGMNKHRTPQPKEVKSPLISEGTIIMGGDPTMMRWGFHVLEGYAKDGKSRITLLLNKHDNEEGRPAAELYYYGTVYNHFNRAYNWFKIGSDVKDHSFMFSRDEAVAYGKVDFRSLLELGAISPSKDLDRSYKDIEAADNAFEPESKSKENARCVLYFALRDARDGAMFYDKDAKKIACKINGRWQYLVTEPAALNIK